MLMCWPRHYAVNYKINPWMVPDDPEQVVSRPTALKQWMNLHHTIVALGVFVEYVEGKPSLPDIVFTANAGLLHKDKFVVSNFKHKERKKESKIFAKWFEDHKIDVKTLPRKVHFEGAGDALFLGDVLFCGHGFRSDYMAGAYVADILGIKEVHFCKLVDPSFYHLDTCFCPLRNRTALVYPDAFCEEALVMMSNNIDIVPVPPQEARNFACNAVVIGNNVIIPKGCPLTRERLIEQNFRVYEVAMTEFIKAGGACKCLTFDLGAI